MTDVSQWIHDLNSSQIPERVEAAQQLSRLGSEASPAAVSLVRAAEDGDETVREWVNAALEELSADPADTAALAELLSDAGADTAYWAASLLGRLGESARSAVGPLAQALHEHPAATVRQRAAWALGKIDPTTPAARKALQKAANSDDPRLARLAAHALEKTP